MDALRQGRLRFAIGLVVLVATWLCVAASGGAGSFTGHDHDDTHPGVGIAAACLVALGFLVGAVCARGAPPALRRRLERRSLRPLSAPVVRPGAALSPSPAWLQRFRF